VARQDRRLGLDVASFVGWYWVTRATSEGTRWLDELLGLGADPHALALFMRGFLGILQSEPVAALPALERSAAAAERAGEPSLRAQALSLASIAAHVCGDLGGLLDGDLALVRSASSEGLRRSREEGDLYSLEMMLLTEALRIARRIDDRVAQYILLDALGCHAAGSSQARRAAHLFGAADTVHRGIGPTLLPHLEALLGRAMESARVTLGGTAYLVQIEAGRAMSRAAALALALEEAPPTASPAAPVETAPLGRREAEVARLVAEGLSNKQIGARPLISEHTVDSHVRSILNKLGFSSRAQVAAWMASSAQ